MHTVELIRQILQSAKEGGVVVREEWLDGAGCALCEIRGKRVLFVDLAISAAETLDQLNEMLNRGELPASVTTARVPPAARSAPPQRKSA